MTLEKNRPATLGNQKLSKRSYNNSATSQRARILNHFANCPRLSTMQAREKYGILHPGGRIMELRKKGYRIDTCWIFCPDSNGVTHRVGQYIYHGKKGELAHEII